MLGEPGRLVKSFQAFVARVTGGLDIAARYH